MRAFSVRHRPADVAGAAGGVLDVLVVGAGATGAGVALDAASRGLSVAVIDRGDLASGTSSKSSKLIHGGLRYLENYDVGLVYEGVNERQLLQRLAPHLVRPMEFVYPIFPDTARVRRVGLGLTTYDVLAGFRNVRRHERITAEEAVEKAPALAGSGLERAYVYGDCATDDARLVLANVVAARRFGAVALTYTEAVRLLLDADGKACGATVSDRLDGSTYDLRARHVVNATGVWVDTLLAQEDPSRSGPLVRPSKGVHLVVPRERVPLTGASILMPSRQGDGRSMFAIPWGRQTILGTTDTAYDGSLDVVAIEEGDVEYILDAGNALFAGGLSVDDVVGAWAGCRPLLRGASSDGVGDLSRRHALTEGAAGLLTITGGKLTTYRRMARDVVDRIVDRDGRRARCRTDEINLGCARPYEDVVAETIEAARLVGLTADVAETAETLVRQHGESAASVLALADSPALRGPLSPAATHLFAEVVYAARNEGAATLEDVFARRTRLSLRARDAALPSAAAAAALLAGEIGRDGAWAAGQVAAYEDAVRRDRGVLGF
ncbi:MAG: glycerol-3-phosphate dehydrogenase [Frankiaceae bacterium]|nr:glycerol-3-phosphate dehydrogenase [Frankiaceae bacterium]